MIEDVFVFLIFIILFCFPFLVPLISFLSSNYPRYYNVIKVSAYYIQYVLHIAYI